MEQSSGRAGFEGQQAARCIAAGRTPAGVPGHLPILRYHSVSHHSPETALPGSVAVSVLEEQLTSLVASGWQLMGVTEALRRIADDKAGRIVALTFDDGLLD